jgi:hypothetical protein
MFYILVMHEILHMLGICGEKHFSFINIFGEGQNFSLIFNYIRYLLIIKHGGKL